MKRIYTLLTLLSCLWFNASAALSVGYCEDRINSSVSNSKSGVTLKAAVGITGEMMQQFPHCCINKIEIGLYDINGVSQLSVWVKRDLNSENIIEKEVSDVTKGWNTIELDTLIKLEVNDTLYFGYEFTQSTGGVKVIGGSGTKNQPESAWIGFNGKWTDYSAKQSPLCIRGGLVSLVDHEIEPLSVKLSPRYQQVASGEKATPIKIEGTVRNMGNDTLRQITVNWMDGESTGEAPLACEVPFGEEFAYSFEVEPHTVGIANAPLNIKIEDWQKTLYYEISDGRNSIDLSEAGILVEQFASLKNGFVPLGQQRMAECLASSGQEGIVLLTHHVGYGPADSLRITAQSDYSAKAIFGKDELSYAPAFSINRRLTASETLPADSLLTLMTEGWAQCQYANTKIAQCNAVWDAATQSISIEVEVAAKTLAWAEKPMLGVVLVQKELPLATGSQKDYYEVRSLYEQNVVRQYLTSGLLLTDSNLKDIMDGREMSPANETISKSLQTVVTSELANLKSEEMSIIVYVYDQTSTTRFVDCVKEVSLTNKAE